MTDKGFSYLQTKIDTRESFARGHGIIQTAGATLHTARMKRVPEWALSDRKIREFIELRFPKFKTDPDQRQRAARTVRLIYLYYRVGNTAAAVAEELGMTKGAVDIAIHRLKIQMTGPLKPSHRPKKDVCIEANQ